MINLPPGHLQKWFFVQQSVKVLFWNQFGCFNAMNWLQTTTWITLFQKRYKDQSFIYLHILGFSPVCRSLQKEKIGISRGCTQPSPLHLHPRCSLLSDTSLASWPRMTSSVCSMWPGTQQRSRASAALVRPAYVQGWVGWGLRMGVPPQSSLWVCLSQQGLRLSLYPEWISAQAWEMLVWPQRTSSSLRKTLFEVLPPLPICLSCQALRMSESSWQGGNAYVL